MANIQRSKQNTINQGSFVNSIKKFILSANNPLSSESDIERRNIKLKNYWRAISNILNKEELLENSALYKTTGFDLFSQITPTVFTQLNVDGNFKVNTIEILLREAFDELDSDYIKMAHADFWTTGSDVSGLNQAAVRKYASELNKAINIARNRKVDIVL